jgi:hypothetical protein
VREVSHVTATIRLRRIARSTGLRSWLVGALLCALFAVETFAVVHPLDLAAHSNGETCKICVGVAGFAAAAVGEAPPLALDGAAPPLFVTTALPLVSATPVRAVARGPPLRS